MSRDSWSSTEPVLLEMTDGSCKTSPLLSIGGRRRRSRSAGWFTLTLPGPPPGPLVQHLSPLSPCQGAGRGGFRQRRPLIHPATPPRLLNPPPTYRRLSRRHLPHYTVFLFCVVKPPCQSAVCCPKTGRVPTLGFRVYQKHGLRHSSVEPEQRCMYISENDAGCLNAKFIDSNFIPAV